VVESLQGALIMAPQSQLFIVDIHSKKMAVLLPIKKYEQLMHDLHDLAVVVERKDEEPISLSEMKKRLRHDGLL
jgi:hypothetical protein